MEFRLRSLLDQIPRISKLEPIITPQNSCGMVAHQLLTSYHRCNNPNYLPTLDLGVMAPTNSTPSYSLNPRHQEMVSVSLSSNLLKSLRDSSVSSRRVLSGPSITVEMTSSTLIVPSMIHRNYQQSSIMYSNAVLLRYIGLQRLGILGIQRRETHNPMRNNPSYSRSMETSYHIGRMVSIGLHSIRQIQHLNYTLGKESFYFLPQ